MTTDLPRHSVSVAGLVFDRDDRILAIRRRDNDQWQPPGGVLEVDETFEEGVRREVLEETGVEVRVERLTGVYKHMKMGVVALVFRCAYIDGTPQTTDESRDVCWLDVSDAIKSMPPTFAVRVQDALQPLVPARVHDGTVLV